MEVDENVEEISDEAVSEPAGSPEHSSPLKEILSPTKKKRKM